MFEQGLATAKKLKNTRLQLSRAWALTELSEAPADTHHSFRLAISVPRRAPGTGLHADALRPLTAIILTRPDADP